MNDNAGRIAESTGQGPRVTPPTDIFETDTGVIMLIEMPGADPDSLDVTLDRRLLTVSAHATPTVPEGYTLMHAEYRLGDYERSFTLSDQIDAERVEAVFKDGVLRLTLPKAASPAKKIEVKAD
jgi:HSP20 family molecular chaperone IbpA